MTSFERALEKKTRKNALKNLVFGEDDCRIINNLVSKKLYYTAGHFYSSVFIFWPEGLKKIKQTRENTQPYRATFCRLPQFPLGSFARSSFAELVFVIRSPTRLTERGNWKGDS